MREATAELGIPESHLTVHDFDVRTFPERRQDILELLVALWEEWRPDVVFQPSHHDVHQDHQTIAQEGLRAFKRTTILGYEIPWNNFDFSYGAYLALERRHVERKVAAVSRYASQQHRRYADEEYIWNLARVHGTSVNRDFAEVFQVYRARRLTTGRRRPFPASRLESAVVRILAASTQGSGHFGPLVPFLASALRQGHEVLVVGPPTLDPRGFPFRGERLRPRRSCARSGTRCRSSLPRRGRWWSSGTSSPG